MTDTKTISTAPIEGRVAQILNERELVLSVGEKNGVKPRMKFAILAESPIEIRDPQTGEVLDELDREKVRVEAIEVRPKITICRTYRSEKIPPGPLYGISAMFNAASAPREIKETLRAADSSMLPPLSPEESYVKINDRAIQVFDE